MNSCWRIFWLEFVALCRTRTLLLTLLAVVGWMVAVPFVIEGDGTGVGLRELELRYSLGGAFAILAVAVLASATASLAADREAGRLQLTLVRPTRAIQVALGRIAALSAAAALVLALAAALAAVRQGDLGQPCWQVLKPILPSPREEAEQMYAEYLADPETPPEVKQAKRSVVLRLLEQRAIDHYQTLPTNAVTAWQFAVPPAAAVPALKARLKFGTLYDTRDEVRGTLAIGEWRTVVSNQTQAISVFDLQRGAAAVADPSVLAFYNAGERLLMLRPRCDVELLLKADGWGWNLGRAAVEVWAVLTLLAAFGVFLGAGLGRAVAMFTAIVLFVVGEISPAVVDRYPDQLETDPLDRIALVITRSAAEVAHPVGSLRPVTALAADERVEPSECLRVVVADALVLPLVFAFLAALVMPRKRFGS